MTFKVKDGLIVGNNSFVNANLDVNANTINVGNRLVVGNTSVYATVNSSFFSGVANAALVAYGGKAESSLNANSALYANQANYANYAIVANSALYAFGGKVESSVNANSAVYAVNAQFAYTANVANFLNGKAESALDANTALYANYATYSDQSNSAVYAVNAEFAYTANVANYLNGKAEQAINANSALYANYATYAGLANAALYSYGGKAEDALNANSATYATNAQFAYTANVAKYLDGVAANALNTNSATYAVNAQFAYVANVANYLNGKAESALDANTALYLNGYSSDYFTNATNITTGTLNEAHLPYRMNQDVRTTDDVQFHDLTITGNVFFTGNATLIQTSSLSTADSLIYLNEALTANVTNATGNGTFVTYTANNNFVAGKVVLVSGMNPVSYNIYAANNLTIETANSTQFTVAKTTTDSFVSGGTASAKAAFNPDVGFVAGLTANGVYQHIGFFRDATDGVFKAFDNLIDEPHGPFIDLASARIADIQANTIFTATAIIGNGSITSSLYSGTANNATYAYGKQENQLSVASANNSNYAYGKQESQLSVSAANNATYLNGKQESQLNANNTTYAFGKQEGQLSVAYAANANYANYLNNFDWSSPGAIGSNVANSGTFTDLTVTGNTILGDSGTDFISINANTIVLGSNLYVDGSTLVIDSLNNRVSISGDFPAGLSNTYKLTVTGDLYVSGAGVIGSILARSGTINASLYSGTRTGSINLAAGQTTGTFYIGGLNQTGAIQIGRSTNNQVIAIANGATVSGNTKTVTIGTGGLSGSNTVIHIGANTAQSNVNIYANLATFSDSILVNNEIRIDGTTINSSFFTATANNALYANNASLLNGYTSTYFTNASNITTGTLPWNVLPPNSINSTSSVTVSNTWTFDDIVINGGIVANGSFGETNQVLASNGTGGLYWKYDAGTQYFLNSIANNEYGVIRLRDANNTNRDVVLVGNGTSQVSSNSTHVVINTQDQFVGTVTSVDAGSGLLGGPITDSGSLYVGAGAGISVNQDDVAVNAKEGLIANSSGLWVNTYYFSILSSEVSSNNALYLQYKTWEAPGSIGNTTPNDGKFLNLQANTLWVKTNVLANGYIWVNGTTINSTYFPASANNAYRAFGKFENQLNVNSAAYTVASNNASYLNGYNWDSPPKIGETTANTGKFTYANVSSHVAFGTAAHMIGIGKITVSGTSPANIIEFPTSIYSGGKLIIEVTDTHTNFRHISEMLLSHDNTTVSATEYGVVQTANTVLATFETDILSGNVRILATPVSSNTTTFKVIQNLFLA